MNNFILYLIDTGEIVTRRTAEFTDVPAGYATADIGNIKPNLLTQKYDSATQSIVDKNNKQQIVSDQCKAAIRSKRNVRLNKTDWTQLPDVDLTAEQKAAWQTYRQSLRDFMDTLPSIIDASYRPTWPVLPNQ